ncbi:MAG TPA: D-alanyl-D-alanine carboxypeptidase/D-alanyl-D-alanine-endopeptidase [Pyrinomonadaceae bacterium]|nr:D-alanyl-D-alanine carboxypeptidase/D-alanyl-D-alanine-endopeptidase [Pyrinomonadaceae bacterium]
MKVGINFIVISTFLFFLTSCFSANQSNQNSQTTETPVEIPTPNINLAKPLEISKLPADISRCEKINQTIDTSEFANARWGIIAISLKDGRVVCARETNKLFNPASTQKLLTSIVALDKLGANFRWKTSVYSTKQIEGDTLNGDLILYGTGAPDFDENGLDKLVNELKNKGLKHIKGNLIGDESYFRGDKVGDGWAWGELQWYYGAEAAALTFNENQAEISLKNGKPVSSTDYVKTNGEVKPTQDIEAIGLKREINENEVYAWGNGANLQAKISVSKPAFWAAKSFKTKLEKNGITVDGEVKFIDWKAENKFDVSNAVELSSTESATLGEIIRKMNKDSVNLYAELILRTLGKKFGETAPDENPKINKLRGDDLAGASVIKKWLAENNIATDDIQIHDGSGLSRLDFVTPEAMGRAIVFASQSKFADVFKSSLPIAGTDGTLRGRLRSLSGKVLAKTGSITYVNALAGYAKIADETFVFVIITNNETRKNDSLSVVDSIVTGLVN